jgi:hypothetical protein
VLLKQQQGAPFGHVAKVTDFGISRCLGVGQSHRSTRTLGTVNHTSPELLRLGRLSPAGGQAGKGGRGIRKFGAEQKFVAMLCYAWRVNGKWFSLEQDLSCFVAAPCLTGIV